MPCGTLLRIEDQEPLIGTPPAQPSPEGEGADFVGVANPEFNSDFHVGVPRLNNSVSPLSLWERARVRVAIWSVFKAVSEFAEPSHKVFRLSVGRAISSLLVSPKLRRSGVRTLRDC